MAIEIPQAQFLSREQAATVLGVSVSTLGRIIKEGKIEHVRVGSGRGRILFTRQQLEDYITLATQVPEIDRRRHRVGRGRLAAVRREGSGI